MEALTVGFCFDFDGREKMRFNKNLEPKPKAKIDLLRHFQKRMRQRFGFEVEKHELDYIHSQIRKCKAECLGRISQTKTLWKINLRDKDLFVLYNSKLSHAVTVLTEKQAESERTQARLKN